MNLPDNSLAYQIANMQYSLGYPGLVRECQNLFEVYGKMGDPIHLQTTVENLLQKNNWKEE